MVVYGSTTTTTTMRASEKSSMSSRWEAMVIFLLLLLTSQVQTQRVVVERWSPHTPAVIGQRVTLACIFSSPVKCTWSTGGHNKGSKEVRSQLGYSYDGDHKTTGQAATKDCSLTIAAVKEQDITMWFCTGYPDGVASPWTYITKQVTPSPPVIWFNSVEVSAIELPSSHPLSLMGCSSYSGNPPPSLHWEVNGTVYSGILETTPGEAINRYTVHLRWDRDSNWQILDHVSEVVCKANHPGFTNIKEAKVELVRKYAPRTVKILSNGFNVDNITIGRGANVTLSCISDGHPQPTNYTWELWSEADTRWNFYRHKVQNITVTIGQLGRYRCRASNGLNRHSPTNSINQIIVTESNGEEATLVNGSSDQGSFGIIAGVLGGILLIAVVIIVILTVVITKFRRRLSRLEVGSKSPSVASVAQLHRTSNPPNANPTTDVSTPEPDSATYSNVGWTNAEPTNVYWESMRIYE